MPQIGAKVGLRLGEQREYVFAFEHAGEHGVLLGGAQAIEPGKPTAHRLEFELRDGFEDAGGHRGVQVRLQRLDHEGNRVVPGSLQFEFRELLFLVAFAEVADVLGDAGRVAQHLLGGVGRLLNEEFDVLAGLLVELRIVGPLRDRSQLAEDGGAVLGLDVEENLIRVRR